MGGRGSGRPKNPPKPTKMLKEVLPVEGIFDDTELQMYNDLVAVYLSDFEDADLSSSDMDDIMDLAKNRVLEFRLLKTSKGNAAKQLDIAGAIEKLGKKNEKIKESLSSRRKDRINPNEFKGFSIVDLAAAFTNERKRELQEKAEKLKIREKEMLEKREGYVGNRYDLDVKDDDRENE
jgi:hypothetical protein